jgi:hypothetical protein
MNTVKFIAEFGIEELKNKYGINLLRLARSRTNLDECKVLLSI